MDSKNKNSEGVNNKTKVLIGLGVGAAIGVGYALSRQKKDAWVSAKQLTKKMASNSGELAAAGNRIIDHVRIIFDEARKVAEDASEAWTHGRRLIRS